MPKPPPPRRRRIPGHGQSKEERTASQELEAERAVLELCSAEAGNSEQGSEQFTATETDSETVNQETEGTVVGDRLGRTVEWSGTQTGRFSGTQETNPVSEVVRPVKRTGPPPPPKKPEPAPKSSSRSQFVPPIIGTFNTDRAMEISAAGKKRNLIGGRTKADIQRSEQLASEKPTSGKCPLPRKEYAGNLVIQAGAGSGKTFTLVEGLNRMLGNGTAGVKGSEQQELIWKQMLSMKSRSLGAMAFGSDIAKELKSRLPKSVLTRTFHGYGLQAISTSLGRTEVDQYKIDKLIERETKVDRFVMQKQSPGLIPGIKKIVSMLKANGIVPDENKARLLEQEALGFGHDLVESKQTSLQADQPLLKNMTGLAKMLSGKKALASVIPKEVGQSIVVPDTPIPWEKVIQRVIGEYGIDVTKDQTEIVFDLVPRLMLMSMSETDTVDYNDMVWLPIALDLKLKPVDVLCVDEAQDLNCIQQILARKAGRRIVLCGDPNQAIYAFAGADSEAMPRMIEKLELDSLGCQRMNLNFTRRCGKAIVREANTLVEQFYSFPDAEEGEVERDIETPGMLEKVAFDGRTMVVCRTNAPLVSQALRLLKSRRKARIRGREIGTELIELIDRLAFKDDSLTAKEFITELDLWSFDKVEKLQALKYVSEQAVIQVQDKRDALIALADSCKNVQEIKHTIQTLFSDESGNEGVWFSSIHKAKGLEAERIVFLKHDTCPHPAAKREREIQQERNLRYVAITRAKQHLLMLKSEQKDKKGNTDDT